MIEQEAKKDCYLKSGDTPPTVNETNPSGIENPAFRYTGLLGNTFLKKS